MKIRINDKYEYLREYIESIPDIFEREGEVVYEDRNLIKNLTAPDGTCLNVKRFCPPRGINKYVYSFGIRKPKGVRAYIYPERLLAKGVPTPIPVAYIEQRRCGILSYCYFISLRCPYEHRMFDVGDAPEGTYEELAVAFARFTADMHQKEVMHLDYSPGNILYRQNVDGSFEFSIVDINRMHFGKVGREQGLLNFKRLWGPKRFFIMMIEEYARVRGYDVAEAVEFTLAARAKFWKWFSKKHGIYFKLEL